MKTGFEDLDNIIQFNDGTFSVLASRPAMGKTTLALNIINNILNENNTPILLFSLELSKESIIDKLISMQLKIDISKIKRTKSKNSNINVVGELLSNDEQKQIYSYMEKMANFKLYIDDTPNISIMEILKKSKNLLLKYHIGMIVIDYLQLVQFNKDKLLSRDEEVVEILHELKKLAKELNIPIIITSQLSKNLEKRENKRPLITDFANSKNGICLYCDNIVFLYRDSYYYEDYINNNNSELIVAKNREGKVGTINLRFLSKYCTFSNKKKEK